MERSFLVNQSVLSQTYCIKNFNLAANHFLSQNEEKIDIALLWRWYLGYLVQLIILDSRVKFVTLVIDKSLQS